MCNSFKNKVFRDPFSDFGLVSVAFTNCYSRAEHLLSCLQTSDFEMIIYL